MHGKSSIESKLSKLLKSGSCVLVGGLIQGAVASISSLERAAGWVRDMPVRRHRDAGWRARGRVGDPGSCAVLVASMDEAAEARARAQAKPGGVNESPGEMLSESSSAALFFALSLAGEDERRLESAASAFGSRAGAAALEARLHVITQAMGKLFDYDLILGRLAERPEYALAVAPCYLGTGPDAALDMACRISACVGSAWLGAWAAEYRASSSEGERDKLGCLAGGLLKAVVAHPIRGGAERVSKTLSVLDVPTVEAIIQAGRESSGLQGFAAVEPTLRALSVCTEFEASCRASPVARPGAVRI